MKDGLTHRRRRSTTRVVHASPERLTCIHASCRRPLNHRDVAFRAIRLYSCFHERRRRGRRGWRVRKSRGKDLLDSRAKQSDFVAARDREPQERQSSRLEGRIDEFVPSFAIRAAMTGVVEFDDDVWLHRTRIDDNVIDVLRGNTIEGCEVSLLIDDEEQVGDPNLREDDRSFRRGLQQSAEEGDLGPRQEVVASSIRQRFVPRLLEAA